MPGFPTRKKSSHGNAGVRSRMGLGKTSKASAEHGFTQRVGHPTPAAKGPKCGRRLANDVGFCDRVRGHSGEHSNAWYRKNRDV